MEFNVFESIKIGLAFTSGNNHASIRNSNADTSYDFGKSIIINTIIKSGWVDIISTANTRYADSMRPYAKACFEMFCVHE